MLAVGPDRLFDCVWLDAARIGETKLSSFRSTFGLSSAGRVQDVEGSVMAKAVLVKELQGSALGVFELKGSVFLRMDVAAGRFEDALLVEGLGLVASQRPSHRDPRKGLVVMHTPSYSPAMILGSRVADADEALVAVKAFWEQLSAAENAQSLSITVRAADAIHETCPVRYPSTYRLS